MVAPTEVSWFMERTVEFSLRLGHARVLTSHRDVIHCVGNASLRRSLHAYLNVIIDLLDDRFLTAKQTNSTIHCRDWRPRQSAKTNGSTKPLPCEHNYNPQQTRRGDHWSSVPNAENIKSLDYKETKETGEGSVSYRYRSLSSFI